MQPLLRFSANTRQPLGEARGPAAAYARQYVGLRGAGVSDTSSRTGWSASKARASSPQRSQSDKSSDQQVGIGVILGLNENGEVVVEDLAEGWPAALSSMLARGDVLEEGLHLRFFPVQADRQTRGKEGGKEGGKERVRCDL